jgi:hypothetical protein
MADGLESSILTWNVPNFVTVTLMVVLGMFLFMFISKAYRSRQSGGTASA